jgi:uncharacterized membrane protein
MRLRWVAAAWTALSVVGWVLAALVWIGGEADCNESASLLCFEPSQIWRATGILAAMIWSGGLLVVAVVALRRARQSSEKL